MFALVLQKVLEESFVIKFDMVVVESILKLFQPQLRVKKNYVGVCLPDFLEVGQYSRALPSFCPLRGLKSWINFCAQSCTNIKEI